MCAVNQALGHTLYVERGKEKIPFRQLCKRGKDLMIKSAFKISKCVDEAVGEILASLKSMSTAHRLSGN